MKNFEGVRVKFGVYATISLDGNRAELVNGGIAIPFPPTPVHLLQVVPRRRPRRYMRLGYGFAKTNGFSYRCSRAFCTALSLLVPLLFAHIYIYMQFIRHGRVTIVAEKLFYELKTEPRGIIIILSYAYILYCCDSLQRRRRRPKPYIIRFSVSTVYGLRGSRFIKSPLVDTLCVYEVNTYVDGIFHMRIFYIAKHVCIKIITNKFRLLLLTIQK